jgi:hypothetical protein
VGRVAEFNDYPGVDMVLPAFSERAVKSLGSLLEPNGELLLPELSQVFRRSNGKL